ncbi:hypothetical protein PHPALM_29039 [Phytophthora palmivora]|uniref:Uncharacterized protein n=1 Tax=Phytophthora palmivora TaxID=4796 RepID=A0A2P4X8K3_9STRA|nr:hypothetical protein PHPALM_29039 [Phytophthora palmivora]
MEESVMRQHVHPSTVYHYLYAHIKLMCSNYPRVEVYLQQHIWLYNYYQHSPLSYLDEAQDAFRRAHSTKFSKTSVWRLILSLGRRAIHIKGLYVFRFVEELSHINWSHQNLVFLDEVSFDNRGMIDKRGYAIRGKAIRHPWRLRKKSPVNGIIDYFNTEGTFDRLAFSKYCQDQVHTEKGLIGQYPDRIQSGSWMEIPYTGTLNYSLSTKCPRRGYLLAGIFFISDTLRAPSNGTTQKLTTFQWFSDFGMSKAFDHCGWKKQGYFAPVGPLSNENRADLAVRERNQDEF